MYYTVEDATIEEIRTLAAAGAIVDDVADHISKKVRNGSDPIKYIAKFEITALAQLLCPDWSWLNRFSKALLLAFFHQHFASDCTPLARNFWPIYLNRGERENEKNKMNDIYIKGPSGYNRKSVLSGL